jgi:hypothetical protein
MVGWPGALKDEPPPGDMLGQSVETVESVENDSGGSYARMVRASRIGVSSHGRSPQQQ